MTTGSLYDRLGRQYDRTRRADARIVDRLSTHLGLQANGAYVDVGCGTGNYTCALAARAGRWYGIDASTAMLAAARDKCDTVSWCQARVAHLPLANGSVEGAICTLAVHYFGPLAVAFGEIRRVLARGCFVIFTSTRRQLRRFWLNHYFPEMMARASARMPDVSELQQALATAGFTDVHTEPFEVPPDLVDWFVFGGKHRPELYLQAENRQAMSPFLQLAQPGQVESGLARLRADIESAQIERVTQRYEHDAGDYTFVIAA